MYELICNTLDCMGNVECAEQGGGSHNLLPWPHRSDTGGPDASSVGVWGDGEQAGSGGKWFTAASSSGCCAHRQSRPPWPAGMLDQPTSHPLAWWVPRESQLLQITGTPPPPAASFLLTIVASFRNLRMTNDGRAGTANSPCCYEVSSALIAKSPTSAPPPPP